MKTPAEHREIQPARWVLLVIGCALLTLIGMHANPCFSQPPIELDVTPLQNNAATVTPTPSLESPPMLQPDVQAPPLGSPNAIAPDPFSAAQPNAAQLNTALPDASPGNLPDFGNDFDFSASQLGGTREDISAAPTMMGDMFGSFLSRFQGQLRVNTSLLLQGRILNGNPGQPDAIIGFNIDNLPDDIFTTGATGIDASGDGNIDTFSIFEPLPTSEAPTSPGQGFIFDPATAQAVYVGTGNGQTAVDGIFNNGENWFVSYDYVATLGDGQGRPVPGPGVAVRRVKIAENYSPEVRDRLIFNYSFFNDAYGGLGDISRYIFGVERILLDDILSFEIRMPVAGTFAGTQISSLPEQRDLEVGNMAFLLKGILLRGDRYLWTGGMGVNVPTAADARLQFNGEDLLRVENETLHLLPFTSYLYRASRDTVVQVLGQIDVAAHGDPVFANFTGVAGQVAQIGTFNDSTQIGIDVAASHVVYRAGRRGRQQGMSLETAMLNAEVHYTGTVQPSDFLTAGGITYSSLKSHFNIVNATFGMHLVLSNDLTVTPAMSVPLRDGLDEQFDYEAIVQMNYLY